MPMIGAESCNTGLPVSNGDMAADLALRFSATAQSQQTTIHSLQSLTMLGGSGDAIRDGVDDLLKVASPKRRIVWLVHSEKISASTRAGYLAAVGYRVISGPWNSSGIVRAKANIPAAVVVDLSRNPSAGRDIAIAMRSHRALLTVPFVLVGGSPGAVRRFLPDAIESSWHEQIETSGPLKIRAHHFLVEAMKPREVKIFIGA